MLIREKDKDTLRQIFSSVEQPPFEVWAHGSRVDGSAHSGSDLDLVIRTADWMLFPCSTFSALTKKIQDSNIPFLVDLMDWTFLPESFHKNIAQQHEVLYRSTV
ncbi:MAG: nucleotidyltransferase domain-containing protein [Prevotellaceae bacterium]|jgi:predicted nucleotidyltransferase|nr:nucleotidyltransferase domain-containing protein [Prevotellaceae bacterium]